MTIRFLETTESETPGFPFQAGQIITVSSLSSSMRVAIDNDRAEVVREEPRVETASLMVLNSKASRRAMRRRAVHV